MESVVQIGTLISTALTAAGLFVGVYVYRRQMNAQLFLDFTRRYDSIMQSFPGASHGARLRLDVDLPQESPELSAAILRYLNLCSEEFYLWRRGYLAKDIWRIWERELEATLVSPLLRREWPTLRDEFGAFSEFSKYVEGVLARDG